MRTVSTQGERSSMEVNIPGRRFSWNTHALITRAALKGAAIQAPEHSVAVVSLSDFVGAAQKDILEVVQWYWDRVEHESGTLPPAPKVKTSPPASEADFVRLIQINPRAGFSYVRLLQPQEVSLDAQHDPSRDGPPGALYVETAFGSQLPARDVLFTFSDEPDWGMDQDLFAQQGQRYGRAPFGIGTGSICQGPFHMAFFHESRLLYLILPALTRSFLEVRCKVFFAFAAIAFQVGMDYWGWRFAAWAMHYLQDVTQPYHARAFPLSLSSVARGLFSSHISTGLGRLIYDMLKWHHLFFEAFVHFLLNEGVKKGTFSELSEALACSEDGVDSGHGCGMGCRPTHKIPPTPPLLRGERDSPLPVHGNDLPDIPSLQGERESPLSVHGHDASDLPSLQRKRKSPLFAHGDDASCPPFLKGGRGDFLSERKKPRMPCLNVKSHDGLRDQSLAQVIRLCSCKPARLAPQVDRTLVELFGDLSLAGAQLFLGVEDPPGIERKFHEATRLHPDTFRRFVSLVCQYLAETGEVTRYALVTALAQCRTTERE